MERNNTWTEYIQLTRIRENNLQDVSLRIPKRQITVFTGVSGAGKSSLVFDTIAAESQRQLNELFSTFTQYGLTKYRYPDADSIENLSTAVVVEQKPIQANSRLTIGITWLLVGNINEALNIGIAISAVKIVIYYLYERTWDYITLGMPS